MPKANSNPVATQTSFGDLPPLPDFNANAASAPAPAWAPPALEQQVATQQPQQFAPLPPLGEVSQQAPAPAPVQEAPQQFAPLPPMQQLAPEAAPVQQFAPPPTMQELPPLQAPAPPQQFAPPPMQQFAPPPAPVQQYAPPPAPPQQFAPPPAPVQQYAPAPAPPQQFAPPPAPVQQYAPAPPPQQFAPPPAPPQQFAPPSAPPIGQLGAQMAQLMRPGAGSTGGGGDDINLSGIDMTGIEIGGGGRLLPDDIEYEALIESAKKKVNEDSQNITVELKLVVVFPTQYAGVVIYDNCGLGETAIWKLKSAGAATGLLSPDGSRIIATSLREFANRYVRFAITHDEYKKRKKNKVFGGYVQAYEFNSAPQVPQVPQVPQYAVTQPPLPVR